MERAAVFEVRSRKDKAAFLHLPWEIHRGDRFWVPPLRAGLRAKIDPRKNPFFEYGEVRLFGVRRDRQGLIARAAAVHNPRHNDKHRDRTGFFGLFESRNDPDAVRELFTAIGEALRGWGCDRMVGPVNFTTNEESGVLIEGFEARPAFMTSYNPPYYDALLAGCGFQKEIDLLSYDWSADHPYPERFRSVVEKLKARSGVRIRPVDRQILGNEMRSIQAVYNAAFNDVWGFVPMTAAEIDDMGKGFKMIADDDLILLAESGGRLVGFCLTLPDINDILKDLNGRLLPFGFLRLVLRRRRLGVARIMVLGVLPAFRDKGVAALLIEHLARTGEKKGYRHGELSVVIESNYRMTRLLDSLGFKVTKRYRLYGAGIPEGPPGAAP
jgi:ribosomal protein S18 acetylase RimI-like enzyme